MAPILIGTASFFLVLLFDLAGYKRMPLLRWTSIVAAAASLTWAVVRLVSSGSHFALSPWLRLVGLVLAPFFLFLLVYSLLVEVQFMGGERNGNQNRLVTTGTYALIRHPGVLWFFLLHLCGAAASLSWFLLAAIPFWTGANILVALVEDRWFCQLTFGNAYNDYRRQVPFVIPSGRSVRKCLATFRQPTRNA